MCNTNPWLLLLWLWLLWLWLWLLLLLLLLLAEHGGWLLLVLLQLLQELLLLQPLKVPPLFVHPAIHFLLQILLRLLDLASLGLAGA